MGAYGYATDTTPFLDSLFDKGVVFDNAITPGYLTFQTDASIFSGLYPSQNNVTQWETPINSKLDLLPKILGFYGYKTIGFFSRSLWTNFGFAKQFDSYSLNPSLKNIAETKNTVSSWIKQAKSPFFVFWHIYDVHSPYIPMKSDYSGAFANNVQWSSDGYTTENVAWVWEGQSTKRICRSLVENTYDIGDCHAFTPDDINYLKADYDSGIQYVDSQLKSFFDSIKDDASYKNTIFVISSEHGEDLKEHGFIFHRDLYNVNTRVPLAIIAPSLSHQKIETTVSSLDIMPTLLGMVGATVPQNIEGIDLKSVMNGNPVPRDIFTERPPFDEYSVIRGNWKYILRNKNKVGDYDAFMQRIVKNDTTVGDELYDLSKDPYEQKNLIGTGLPIENELKNAVLQFKDKMKEAQQYNANIGKVLPFGGPLIPYP
jgi:arylsulfatase A-like enzyme